MDEIEKLTKEVTELRAQIAEMKRPKEVVNLFAPQAVFTATERARVVALAV